MKKLVSYYVASFPVPLQESPHRIGVGTLPFGMEVRPVALELIGVSFSSFPPPLVATAAGVVSRESL